MPKPARNTQKFNYFRNYEDPDSGTIDYIPHYTCGLLTNSSLYERFEQTGSYKLRLSDHNFNYDLKIAYASGDFDGIGIMVKSIGVYAESKDPKLKSGGLLFETTPYFVESQTGGGRNVYHLGRLYGQDFPEEVKRPLRIIAGVNNFLCKYEIPLRGSTKPAYFRRAFGEGNCFFTTYMNRLVHEMAAVSAAIMDDSVGVMNSVHGQGMLDGIRQAVQDIKDDTWTPNVTGGSFLIPTKGKNKPNHEIWLNVELKPNIHDTNNVLVLFQRVQALTSSHTVWKGARDYGAHTIDMSFVTNDAKYAQLILELIQPKDPPGLGSYADSINVVNAINNGLLFPYGKQ